jgi:hypothetical protein
MAGDKHHKIRKLAHKISKVQTTDAKEIVHAPAPTTTAKAPAADFRFKMMEEAPDSEELVTVAFEVPSKVKQNGGLVPLQAARKPSETQATSLDGPELEARLKEAADNAISDYKKVQGDADSALIRRLTDLRKTVLFPNSILEPVQTIDLENHLVGKLARTFCIYRVNSVMVFNDESYSFPKKQIGHDPSEFIIKILQYLETPQYLRKALFPLTSLLRNAGLLNPLDCKHHLKVADESEFREGVILNRPVQEKKGSWADIGLAKVDLSALSFGPVNPARNQGHRAA